MACRLIALGKPRRRFFVALEAITKADGLSGMDYGGDYDLGGQVCGLAKI